jgi:hypothetical protein
MQISDLDQFTQDYIACALWLADEDPGSGDWSHNIPARLEDLAPEAVASMIEDCETFRNDAKIVAAIDGRQSRAGHDFWLTRNGHGAGFWDGDWPEAEGDMLTMQSKKFGEVDLYRGDDGKLYLA